MSEVTFWMIAMLWPASVMLAFYFGTLIGNKKCNDWWNQYGAQIFAERGAVIYGTALYKQPVSQPQNSPSSK